MADTERILILDKPDRCVRLKTLLQGQGWEICGVSSVDEALQRVRTLDFDVAVVNINAESVDPCKTPQDILSLSPDIRVIVLTEYSSFDRAVEALRKGAHAYALRPFALDALVKTIEKAFAQKKLIVSERRRAEVELTEAKQEIDRLVEERVLHLLDANAQLKQELESLRGAARFRPLYETAQYALFIKNRDLKYTEVSPATEKLFGRPDLEWIGKTDEEIFGEEAARPLREADERVLGGEISDKEQIIPVIGVLTPFHVTRVPLQDHAGAVMGLWGIARDLTETKRLERQTRTAQRIESLGILAGGIAHNFNNLFTGILGTVSLLLMDMDPADSKYRKLKRVEDYVRSGVDLTRQLLGFARGGKYEVKVVDLNEIVEKATADFARTRQEITIHREWEHNLWPVKADPGQIEQVLLNLYLNAWQAMSEGGDLYVKTKNVFLDRTWVRSYTIEAGRYAQVAVKDTGIGMDLQTQERIFEPFFTTREIGKGTGLGLAAVYGIVKSHGGFIHVTSEKGRGTTVELLFPALTLS